MRAVIGLAIITTFLLVGCKPEEYKPPPALVGAESKEKNWFADSQPVVPPQKENPEINWVSIGISTGKHSEDIWSDVFQTKAACLSAKFEEDHTCFPISALPASYWNDRLKTN